MNLVWLDDCGGFHHYHMVLTMVSAITKWSTPSHVVSITGIYCPRHCQVVFPLPDGFHHYHVVSVIHVVSTVTRWLTPLPGSPHRYQAASTITIWPHWVAVLSGKT